MRTLFACGALVALLGAYGCAADRGGGASAQFTPPTVHVVDGKRKEYLLGSKLPRDSRENSEYTKTMSPRAYEDGRREQTGLPDGRLPM